MRTSCSRQRSSLTSLRLVQVSPHWIESYDPKTEILTTAADLSEARGIGFQCPKCDETLHPHAWFIMFYGRGVPEGVLPNSRFVVHPDSQSFDDLTLEPRLHLFCGASFEIKNGRIIECRS